jgi:hypothetical protein
MTIGNKQQKQGIWDKKCSHLFENNVSDVSFLKQKLKNKT